MSDRATRFKVALFGYALIVLALVAISEITLGFLPTIIGSLYVRSGFTAGRLIYLPPTITKDEYDRYLVIRDHTLGWPAIHNFGSAESLDETGARLSPAFPKPGRECISLYGDSFTFGSEVSDKEAWGNLLAERLKCRVANFGIWGYGTDQALLRYTQHATDSSAIVVLGIYGDDLRRNVNQYSYFLTAADFSKFGLKPRFVLENGALKLIPILTVSFEEFQQALIHPEMAWQHETFLPGSSHGPTVWSFPYTLSLGRLLASARFWDLAVKWGREEPSWIDYLRQDHPSQALPITVAIVDQFRRVAAQRHQRVLVIIFPSASSFYLFRHTGKSPFNSLATTLNEKGIPTRDLTEYFATYLKDRDFCEILLRGCAGHFTAEGNEVVAKAVQESIATFAGAPEIANP